MRYLLGPIGGLLIPWLVIRNGSVEAWGRVVTPMILVQLSVHLLAWGNKDLLLRDFGKPGARAEDLWRENYLARVPFILLLPVPMLFLPAAMIAPGWTLLWSLALFGSNAMEALIVQRRRFSGAFLADLTGLLVQLALIIGATVIDLSTISRSFAIGQASRACLLVLVSGADPLSPLLRMPAFAPWRTRFRSQIVGGLPFFLIGVSGLLGSRMDLYMMNLLAGREQAGTYQVVSGLFLQFQVLPGLIAMPFARELHRLDHGRMRRASGRLIRFGLLLIAPFVLIAWLLFTIVFRFDLPWHLYAAGVLAALPAYAYVPLINILFKQHRERIVMWASFLAAALMMVLTIALVPAWGISGAMVAAAAGQWACCAVLVRAASGSSNSTR